MAELKKALGFPVLLIITLSAMMGEAVFFQPSIGAKYAGPASLISWAIISIVSIYMGACFAELSSMFPKSGGIYEYGKHVYGRFVSFLIGWVTLIASNIAIAMLIVASIMCIMPTAPMWAKIGSSLFFIFAFNAIAYRGIETSAVLLTVLGVVPIIIMVFVTVPGLWMLNTSGFTPFFPFPLTSIFVAIFFIAETLSGWEAVTFLSEETKDAERVIPKALIWGTVILCIMTLLFIIASIGIMPWQQFSSSAIPLADIGGILLGSAGKKIFIIAIYIAIMGSVAGWTVSAPRLLLALAHDRLFLSQLSQVHEKYHTPYKAIIFQAILTSVLTIAAMGSYVMLLSLVLPLLIVMYSSVMLTLVILRYRKPDLKRYFKVPFGKIGPIIIILFNIALVGAWLFYENQAFSTLKLAASFVLLGFPTYMLIEMYYDPKMIRSAEDITARFDSLFEKFVLKHKVRREILDLLGDVKDSAVLEYGCGTGTFTAHLAEEVGPKGIVHATGFSKNKLKITERRMKHARESSYEKIHADVNIIHDEEHTSRVHPSINYVNAIVSFASLSYMQDVKKVLKEMHRILPEGGKICFVEYGDFFRLIPNVEWLGSNEKIQQVFSEAGFRVRVLRKKGIFWNYIYVYGMKYSKDVPFI